MQMSKYYLLLKNLSSKNKYKKNCTTKWLYLYLTTIWLCIMIERRDVFQAIADPTRRMIIQKLSRGPQNLAGIIEDFGISRQAIAKHIKVLNECGMVSITPKGREQVCEIKLARLDEVNDWVAESRKLWNQRFDKLEKFLDDTSSE
jgi:DNA-binding transcriptional ArsR family regulator